MGCFVYQEFLGYMKKRQQYNISNEILDYIISNTR